MLKSRLSPFRRLRLYGVLLALMLAAGCNLNPGPQQVSISGAPEVRLISPQPNATYLEGVPVNIQASVTNAGADIDRVEISVNEAIIQTLAQPNTAGGPVFSVTHSWIAESVGTHTVGVTAFRADGSSSETATASINVIASANIAEETTEAPVIPTLTLPPTAPETEGGDEGGDDAPPEETANEGGDEANEESTQEQGEGRGRNRGNQNAQSDDGGGDEGGDDSGEPMVRFLQGANVRRGPSTNFVPPIGSFAPDQTAELLGVNPAGDWYKVRYYNAEGWVFAPLVEVSGNVSNLPVDPGPPTPIPATSTPVPPTAPPATAVPQSQANLVAGNIRLDPQQPRCNEVFNVRVDLANLGTSDTTTTGTFIVRDSDGEETRGAIPIIKAGETVGSAPIPITVSTNHSTEHTITVILNPDGAIPETNSGDNQNQVRYELRKGDC